MLGVPVQNVVVDLISVREVIIFFERFHSCIVLSLGWGGFKLDE